jgi:hypothetical protein
VDRQDRHHHRRVGQNLGGSVSLERHSSQCGGKGMAAMPQPPACVELEAAPVLFGVDHEHPTGADHKVINIGCRAWDGQVVQDGPPVPLQRSKQPGGAPLPRRSPPPGDGVGARLKPKPPADRHSRQREGEQA